jgi:hypothetical protein
MAETGIAVTFGADGFHLGFAGGQVGHRLDGLFVRARISGPVEG